MQDLGEAFHPNGLISSRGDRYSGSAYAADGQLGTVLKCYREHQMSADHGFLKRNWPRIKKVLDYSIAQDGNEDGIIDNEQPNTYDIRFHGPNTYVGSLYLAALRAGEQMAGEVGDDEFARRLRGIFERGRHHSVEQLWNGEYFVQRVDLTEHPEHQYGEGCLSDQLFGQGWAHHVGLGYLYPRSHVHKALQSIWKYNWLADVGPYNAAHKPQRVFARPREAGLLICTWPGGRYLDRGVCYRNEVWTGIEYQLAGHMIWENMLSEAMTIVRGIHDRYAPLKRNPFNEVECGDHYARALASWGVFTALCGYEYHGPEGHLGFSPRLTPAHFRAAFTAAAGWGVFCQDRQEDWQRERIALRWGSLKLRSLAFAVGRDRATRQVDVVLANRHVPATFDQEGDRITIRLTEEICLEKGDMLRINIR